MRALLLIACVSLASPLALGQTSAAQDKDAKVKEELRKLWLDYNEAGSRGDRQALERLFAEEWVWIYAIGRTIDRTKHLNNMTSEAWSPAPVPTFDHLVVYGDAAVTRRVGGGATSTTIYAKKDGRWQFAHVQGTWLPPERKPVEIDPKLLDAFVGSYEFRPGAVATVTKEGNTLMWKSGGRPKVRLLPLSETHFFVEDGDLEITFRKGDKGQTTGIALRLGTCQESEAKRVEVAR
jgi:Domain of unknown function (DUF3471)/Domain of unknown function (DUF4440)